MKPEALFIADELEAQLGTVISGQLDKRAAAELRRLYDFGMDQQGKIYALEMARSMEKKTASLKQNELLNALQYMLNVCPAIDGQGEEARQQACAAIANAGRHDYL
jgi:hypothetical protein